MSKRKEPQWDIDWEEEVEAKRPRVAPNASISITFDDAEVNYYNKMRREEEKLNGTNIAELKKNEDYSLEHFDIKERATDIPFLDPNVTENRKHNAQQYIRVIRYDLSINDNYIPLREFGIRYDQKEDLQQQLEKKFTNLYRVLNSRIIKELFMHPTERKMGFNPLGSEWVKTDPNDNCQVQLEI